MHGCPGNGSDCPYCCCYCSVTRTPQRKGCRGFPASSCPESDSESDSGESITAIMLGQITAWTPTTRIWHWVNRTVNNSCSFILSIYHVPCTVIELFLSFHMILPIILWGSEVQSNVGQIKCGAVRFRAISPFWGCQVCLMPVYAVEASQIPVELKSLTSKPLSGDCSLGTARVPDPWCISKLFGDSGARGRVHGKDNLECMGSVEGGINLSHPPHTPPCAHTPMCTHIHTQAHTMS